VAKILEQWEYEKWANSMRTNRKKFTDENITEGSHQIEFYFEKGSVNPLDENAPSRKFLLTIRKGYKSECVTIEECNTKGYILNTSTKIDPSRFNDLIELAGGIFFEICEFTNNLMNTL